MATTVELARGAGGSGVKGSWATLALCYFVAMFEGFDLQAAGVAAPRLGPAFGLSQDQLGLFLAISTFGLMIGAAVGGQLSDRFGRKAVLLGSIAIFGLLSIVNGLATSVEMLMVARFLTGVGLGGALPNMVALANENASEHQKSTFVGVLYAGMPSGGAVAALVSMFGPQEGWRTIFLVGGVVPLLLLPLVFFLLPESPEQRAAKMAGQAERGRVRFGEALFGERRGALTILLWISFFLALLIMYVLLSWLPTLMVDRGLPREQAALVQVSFNIFSAIASVCIGLLMDRRALTVVVAGAFGMAAVGLAILAFAPVALGISLVVGGVMGATISTTQALLYALAPMIYPTSVRGTGVGSAVCVGRFGSAVGPMVVGRLRTMGATPQQVVLLLIPVIILSGLAAFVVAVLKKRRPA